MQIIPYKESVKKICCSIDHPPPHPPPRRINMGRGTPPQTFRQIEILFVYTLLFTFVLNIFYYVQLHNMIRQQALPILAYITTINF